MLIKFAPVMLLGMTLVLWITYQIDPGQCGTSMVEIDRLCRDVQGVNAKLQDAFEPTLPMVALASLMCIPVFWMFGTKQKP